MRGIPSVRKCFISIQRTNNVFEKVIFFFKQRQAVHALVRMIISRCLSDSEVPCPFFWTPLLYVVRCQPQHAHASWTEISFPERETVEHSKETKRRKYYAIRPNFQRQNIDRFHHDKYYCKKNNACIGTFLWQVPLAVSVCSDRTIRL